MTMVRFLIALFFSFLALEANAQAPEAFFSCDGFEIAAGETKVVQVRLTSKEENIYGFQLRISLPDGLSFAPMPGTEARPRYAKLDSERAPSDEGYTITTSKNIANLKSAVFLSKNDNSYPYYRTSGEIFSFAVTANENATMEDASITFSDIEIVKNVNVQIWPSDFDVPVKLVPEAYFSCDDFEIAAGETKVVKMRLKSLEDNIYGFQLRITLPDELSFAPVSGTESRPRYATLNSERAPSDEGYTITTTKNIATIKSAVFLSKNDNSYPYYGTSGELFYFAVTASENITVGKHSIKVSEMEIVKDVNVQIWPSDFELFAVVFPPEETQDNYVTISQGALMAGGEQEMNINLISGKPYTAFQMDLRLPNGFELIPESASLSPDIPDFVEVYKYSLTERIFSQPQLFIKKHEEDGGFWRIAAMSQDLDVISFTDKVINKRINPILKLKYRVDANVAAGLYDAEVFNVKFVSPLAEPTVLPGYTNTILIENNSVSVPLRISNVGLSTLMLPFDAELKEGMHAYSCIDMDEDGIVLLERSSIEKNTPYLIKGNPGTYSFTGKISYSQESYSDFLLTGVYVRTRVPEGNYLLQNHNGVTAFYRIGDPNGEELQAYKCYLSLPENVVASKAPTRLWILNDATAISDVVTQDQSQNVEKYYNLSGQRVGRGYQGIIVKNGKKLNAKK